MAKLTLNNITSGFASTTATNTNNDLVEAAIENTLSRDGQSPNQMEADLDMNGHRIINALAQSGDGFIWYGPWVTGTSYVLNNMVSNSGNSYICTVAHTANADFGIDLGANKWQLIASQGAAGSGTGDMLKSENLSGLANISIARANLGLAVGTDVQAQNANLQSLTAFTTDIDGTLTSNSDTKLATQKATKTYVDTKTVLLTGNQTIAGVKTFSSTPILPAQSMVRLATANGYGSTNTTIRRFTTIVTNQGTDITYADSVALGASFTINTSGVYAISLQESPQTANATIGISLNSTQLTTSISTITAADRIAYGQTYASTAIVNASVIIALVATDVIRVHNDGSAASVNPMQFTITRVA